jgi:predicted TIM-barrel fold metal-dependent hydrolase
MRPIPYIDDVAADFPELKIVCAHISWPWEDEMLAIAKHKRNVYIDLSGELPSRIPDRWKQMLIGPMKNKFLFGTDYPVISPKDWLADFEKIGFDEETKKHILYKNAKNVLNIK